MWSHVTTPICFPGRPDERCRPQGLVDATVRGLSDAIFIAYFLKGQNIADRDVLVPIGARHAFTEREAHTLLDDEPGSRRRIACSTCVTPE